MKIFAVIPARYAATRFHAKLLQQLGEKSVIAHTYQNTLATGLFDEILVATDSDLIYHEISSMGGKVFMSKKEHESGSDRIAEAIENLDVDIVVNVQGDEPFIQKEPLKKLIDAFHEPMVEIASLMHKISETADIDDPNIVKVVVNAKKDALYFSRSRIPYHRNADTEADYFRHIGVYGFRKETLLRVTRWPLGVLEQIERLEQLRYLEQGIHIRMVQTHFQGIGIDTPEDLEKARKMMAC